jgi:hypothetical protein
VTLLVSFSVNVAVVVPPMPMVVALVAVDWAAVAGPAAPDYATRFVALSTSLIIKSMEQLLAPQFGVI